MGDPRPWTYAALFGALWGALELSVGTVLHLARVPMYGMLMAFLGLLCLVTLRRLQPRLGVCLLAGMVAAFLKVFTMGGLYPGPLVGILSQSLLVELSFLLLRSHRLAAVAAGSAVVVAAPLQWLIWTWLVAGEEAIEAVVIAVSAVIARAGGPPLPGRGMLAILLLVAGVIGAGAGHVSWIISGRVLRRLGKHPVRRSSGRHG